MRTILIVDDNASVRQLLRDYLTEQGYAIQEAANGQIALDLITNTPPDLILLDVMMPKMDGYQLVSRLRKQSNVPIIMLTAKRQETDIVRGFELGADDYIVKPFRMRELLMRVRARLRGADLQSETAETLTVGELQLDCKTHKVLRSKAELDLTPVEFYLLEALMTQPGQPLSRAEMSMYLIERGYKGSENTLKIHIQHLRKKIELDTASPRYIETVFGIGYRIKAPQA